MYARSFLFALCVALTIGVLLYFFFSSRRRHTRCLSDWSSDVCSSDLELRKLPAGQPGILLFFDFKSDHPGPVKEVHRLLNLHRDLVTAAGRRSDPPDTRSEERRVGKECRSRWWQYTVSRNKQAEEDRR